jgi:hypothetical protein
MNLSRETRVFCGVILLTVPTIMYGGATLLGILTRGTAGLNPGGIVLDDTQWALFRAGHAHAGVWVILSLILELLLDSATLQRGSRLLARVSGPLGAVALPGAFFGLAFVPGFRLLLYFGAAAMALALGITGVGLVRTARS